MKKILLKIILFLIYHCAALPKYEKWWSYRNAMQSENIIKNAYFRCKYVKLVHAYGASIPETAQFADRPNLPHGLYGIFISEGAIIGHNCTIFQQVTIGSNTLSDSKGYGAPIIGDNVYIGSGAKIIGGIIIGNNVRIGANCVVCQNVDDNATIVMEQPRTIQHKEPRNNDFCVWKS